MKTQPVTLKSSLDKYEVTILESSADTDGAYSLLEVNLFAGGGNEMHYHTTFSEHFEVLSGVLSVQIGKKIHQLQPGERYTVAPHVHHRFFNEFEQSTVFRCTISPARDFEKVLKIGYGLANDGLVTKKGMPKNFWHAVILFQLAESYLCGLPHWFQVFVFGALAKVARWLKADRALMKYYA